VRKPVWELSDTASGSLSFAGTSLSQRIENLRQGQGKSFARQCDLEPPVPPPDGHFDRRVNLASYAHESLVKHETFRGRFIDTLNHIPLDANPF